MTENIRITRAEKKAGKMTYQDQFTKVRDAEARLALDWNDLQAWDNLNIAQEKLEEVRMEKLEKQKNRAGAI